DYVRATLSLEGVPIHLVDTAGLRDASDEIERIGIERTWKAIETAGAALFVTDATRPSEEEREHRARLPRDIALAHVVNKIDLTGAVPGRSDEGGETFIRLSAKTGEGIDALRTWLLAVAGWKPHGEGLFMARERHLVALAESEQHLSGARQAQAFE